jgi:hypothetical protein
VVEVLTRPRRASEALVLRSPWQRGPRASEALGGRLVCRYVKTALVLYLVRHGSAGDDHGNIG